MIFILEILICCIRPTSPLPRAHLIEDVVIPPRIPVIEDVVIPPRISKAIPIIAPPLESPKTAQIKALLTSIEGKPIHEKKQLLGDQLFPLVKVKKCLSLKERERERKLKLTCLGYWSQTRTKDYHSFIGYH